MPFLVARFAVHCVEGVNFSFPAMHRSYVFGVEKVFPRFDAFSNFMPFSGGFHKNKNTVGFVTSVK
jgi:hypothetical protein